MKNKIYNYLLDNNITIEKDVFNYGFEFFYSYFIYLLFIVPISIFNNTFINVALFIAFYIPVRKNIGGFHLKNKYHCIILSIIMTLLAPYISNYISINYSSAIFIIFLNLILYIFFAPTDCKEKHLSNKEKNYYNFLSIIIHLIYSFILLFTCSKNIQFLFQIIFYIELVSSFSICLAILKQHLFNSI